MSNAFAETSVIGRTSSKKVSRRIFIMRKAIPATALLFIFAAAPLFAQNPGAGRGDHQRNIATMVQMRVKRLTTLLDLTPGEQAALTELFTKDATANQPLMSSMRTAEQALRTAEKNNDSAGIQSASTQIGTITGELTALRASLNIGIEASLTPDQLVKYKALGPAAGGGPGFRGPGGWRGGPAGL
jgi:Spy/CpxP family protein refolding chaperone